jgi:hypothetical protein
MKVTECTDQEKAALASEVIASVIPSIGKAVHDSIALYPEIARVREPFKRRLREIMVGAEAADCVPALGILLREIAPEGGDYGQVTAAIAACYELLCEIYATGN